ncbi:hypothetical protein V6R21_11310 [Limibacter armeniacum]|uniref:hypothetical protein n=1 Tax=Limibacter armeniacum TaxID=466084 RepID=UPI002FE5EAC2
MNFNYSIGATIGKRNNFIDNPSFLGWGIDYRRMVGEQVVVFKEKASVNFN